MADNGRSDFCVVFTMSLCALESKQMLISLAALKLGTQSLRSYLKVSCQYDVHIFPNTKVTIAKDHGENYMKVRPALVRHLLSNRLYLLVFHNMMAYHPRHLPNLYVFFLLAL